MTAVTFLAYIIAIGFTTVRIVMFVVFDSIFERPRLAIHDWLSSKDKGWADWLLTLVSCQFCLGVWVSAAIVGLTIPFARVPLPVWVWLGAAAASSMYWRKIDPNAEDIVRVEMKDAGEK